MINSERISPNHPNFGRSYICFWVINNEESFFKSEYFRLADALQELLNLVSIKYYK